MPLCSELMSRPKKAVAGSRPERTTPGGSSRAGRGRQYCKLRWLLSPVIGIFQCIFELKMPRPVIWQRFTSTNSCHEPPLCIKVLRHVSSDVENITVFVVNFRINIWLFCFAGKLSFFRTHLSDHLFDDIFNFRSIQ